MGYTQWDERTLYFVQLFNTRTHTSTFEYAIIVI